MRERERQREREADRDSDHLSAWVREGQTHREKISESERDIENDKKRHFQSERVRE